MEFERVVRARFSARAFRPEQVPDSVLTRILELAQCTPSWCNTQPWELVITRGTATERVREALYAHAKSGSPTATDFPFPAAYEGVYRDRRKVCGIQLYQSLGIGKDDRAAAAEQSLENFRFFGAPHVAIVTTEEQLGAYGLLDCGLYVQTFMLAAVDAGLDCIAQAALASHADFLHETLSIPSHRRVVCGIAFGYSDRAAPINAYRTERAAIARAVRFVDA